MNEQEQKKLFAEWTDDYAARREIDQRERSAKVAGLPPHPWPSEIAKANRLKEAEQDLGKSGGQEHGHGYDEGHSM